MIGHKTHSLANILNGSSAFNAILNKVGQLAKLNRIVHQHYDREITKYCRVANFRDGILVLTTPSPATGHLLRFTKSDLLSKLTQDPEWCHLKSITIHVRPEVPVTYHNYPAPLAQMNHKPSLSGDNVETIKTTALTIDCPALQKALLKLAKTKHKMN